MPADPRRIQELFVAALDLADPLARQEFLDRQCAADLDLRRRLAALLMAHDDPATTSSLSRAHAPAADLYATGPEAVETPATPGSPITVLPPQDSSQETVIAGRYKLLEQLGEGGMGTVFLAEQTQPVKRLVALKIIKPGMDSRQIIARFEAERQALALMDHPHIAKVLDAGSTEIGRPYFVMELIKGTPITTYCDEQRLPVPRRLELFVSICQALQHAHQKGIIHRDIKPSNVLVATYDDKPVVKIIDFGIAKAIGPRLTDQTLLTELGAVMGTLQYMSPEQAELSNLDIDTRSDIYSLGVLLFELLTGTTPLDMKQLRGAAFAAILMRIQEQEPPRLSARLGEAKESLAMISARRGTEPAKLIGLVSGELDWIVMKCLEKDRSRRYDTANGLARDLERYLADEAVEACPPSARYRLGKFARRNRAALTSAAALALLLLTGAAVSTWQAVRATRAETKAVAEKDRADEEAAVATAVNDFLRNDMLAEAAPAKNARKKKVTVEEVLGRAAAGIAGKFPTQPRIEAAIRQTIGDTYRALGDYAAAQPHQERAEELYYSVLGEEHPDTLESMNNLGHLYVDQGLYNKAEPIYVKTLELRRRVLGQEHHSTLASMNNLGTLYLAQGQYTKAEPLYVETLEVSRRVLGEDDPHTFSSMSNLAVIYQAQSQFAKAEPLFLKTLEISSRVQGEEHPDTLNVMNNLAGLYHVQGQLAKAEPFYVKAVEGRRRVLGQDHPNTLLSMSDLAALYWSLRKFDLAIPLFETAFTILKTKIGPDHPDTLRTMANLGVNYRDAGRLKDAIPLLEDADRRIQALPPKNQFSLTWVRGALADTYARAGLLEKEESLLREQMGLVKQSAGLDSSSYAGSQAMLAHNLLQQKKWAEAEPILRGCLIIREKNDADAWTTFNTKSSLGDALLGQKKYAAAESPLLAGYQGMKERETKIPPDSKVRLVEALERLVKLYEATGKKDQVAQWRNKLAAEKVGSAVRKP